jgi:hypothetical protein
MRKCSLIGGLLLLAALSAAEAGGGQPKYATPQEAFDAANKALQRGDWKAACGTLTDDSRDLFAGGMVFAGLLGKGLALGFAKLAPKDKQEDLLAKIKAQFKPVDDALAKHGLTEEVFKKMEKKGGEEKPDLKDPEQVKKLMKALVAPVKDRCALIVDLMAALEKTGDKQKGKGGLIPPGARLTDVKVEGDKARGVVVSKEGDEEKRTPLEFRRVAGSWRIELPVTELFKGPGKGKAPPPPPAAPNS